MTQRIFVCLSGQSLYTYGCNFFSCNEPWGSGANKNVLIIKYRQDYDLFFSSFFCRRNILYFIHKSIFYAQLLYKIFHMEPKRALLPSPSALLSFPTSHLLLFQQVPNKASWNIPKSAPLPPPTHTHTLGAGHKSFFTQCHHCANACRHLWHAACDKV